MNTTEPLVGFSKKKPFPVSGNSSVGCVEPDHTVEALDAIAGFEPNNFVQVVNTSWYALPNGNTHLATSQNLRLSVMSYSNSFVFCTAEPLANCSINCGSSIPSSPADLYNLSHLFICFWFIPAFFAPFNICCFTDSELTDISSADLFQ